MYSLPMPDDPVVRKYREEADKRAQARTAARKPIIDFTSAMGMPVEQVSGATMADIGKLQNAVAQPQNPSQPPAGMRADTIAGLAALKAASERQMSEQPAPPQVPVEPPAPAPERPSERGRFEDVDDLQLERVLALSQPDQEELLNDKEREAVEARLEPIDILEGLLTNEYTQRVPIIPGRFEVTYRTVSSAEDQAIRLRIFELAAKDARVNSLSGDLYRLYTLIAGVVQINGEKLPAHIKSQGHTTDIDVKALDAKLEWLTAKPLPLAHTLAIHQFWFDRRVRKAFTTATETIKNG